MAATAGCTSVVRVSLDPWYAGANTPVGGRRRACSEPPMAAAASEPLLVHVAKLALPPCNHPDVHVDRI